MAAIGEEDDRAIERWAKGLREELLPGLREVGPQVFTARPYPDDFPCITAETLRPIPTPAGRKLRVYRSPGALVRPWPDARGKTSHAWEYTTVGAYFGTVRMIVALVCWTDAYSIERHAHTFFFRRDGVSWHEVPADDPELLRAWDAWRTFLSLK